MGRLRTALGAADGALLALRDRLTPGQRWTAALALGLVVLVLVFGMPTRVVVVPASPASAGPVAEGVAAPAAAPASRSPSPSVLSSPIGALPAAPPLPVDGDAGFAPPAAGAEADAPPAPFGVGVVLGPGGLPGRGDAEMAATFVGPSTVLTDCASAASVTVVLAARPLAGPLAECLVSAGVTVVSPDPLGSTSDTRLSTRRGAAAALADVAPLTAGRVGVVLGASLEAVLRPALARLTGVVATAVVRDPVADVAAGVQAFVAARVQTVVFAVPVDVQRRWVGQHQLLGAPGRWLVADVYDAVADEAYPPLFDGALAVTSSRLPWYARDHGETAEQRACRLRWEAAAAPGVLPGELPMVLAWCQLGTIVAAARTGPVARSRIPSPVTSTLGPAGGTWGPTEDAVLVWRADCACWKERTPFRVRRAA